MRSASPLAFAVAATALATALAAAFSPASRHALAVAEDREPQRLAVYPDTLPAGPGREIATQSCLLCHTATLLTQQRKDSTGWAKTLAQMEAWGAPVAPSQRDSLLQYLRGANGPR